MEKIATALDKIVDESAEKWRLLEESQTRSVPAPGKWCAAEILGHLVDSAANNHQRFVRAQAATSFDFPKYEQNEWVARQDYAQSPWSELLEFWRLYNRHLAHVIRRVPKESLDVPCRIGPTEPVTLRFLIEDYLDHLRHHLNQLEKQI